MADKTVILSGYLPGEEYQGLTALGDQLIGAFYKRKPPEDIVFVGVVRRNSVKTWESGDKPPQVEMRVALLEPITDPDVAAQVRAVLDARREARTGQSALIESREVGGDDPRDRPGSKPDDETAALQFSDEPPAAAPAKAARKPAKRTAARKPAKTPAAKTAGRRLRRV